MVLREILIFPLRISLQGGDYASKIGGPPFIRNPMWKLAALMFAFLGSSEGLARGWPEYDEPPSELFGLFLLAMFIYLISKR